MCCWHRASTESENLNEGGKLVIKFATSKEMQTTKDSEISKGG
jgi:hypothetical protein